MIQNGRLYLARHGQTVWNAFSRHISPEGLAKFREAREKRQPFVRFARDIVDYLQEGSDLQNIMEGAGFEYNPQTRLHFPRLSPKGISQAQRLAQYLLRENISFSGPYSSSKGRAVATARIIHPGDYILPHKKHPILNEILISDIDLKSPELVEYVLENFSSEDLVVGHKHTNVAIVRGLGYTGEFSPGNCSLATLNIEDGRIAQLEYVANEQMS